MKITGSKLDAVALAALFDETREACRDVYAAAVVGHFQSYPLSLSDSERVEHAKSVDALQFELMLLARDAAAAAATLHRAAESLRTGERQRALLLGGR